jgi:two-component system sensor histidine kinase TctE
LGTNVDGSGLGLPIVKEIAQQHGASVTVDATHPGHTPPGACFTLRFNAPA